METLSHNDIFGLNNAIAEIYASRDIESFYETALSSIQGIIPTELSSASDMSAHDLRLIKPRSPSQAHLHVAKKLMNVFNAYINEHPFYSHFSSGRVVRMEDFASRSQFKATAIYNEYYRHLDIETQIGFTIPVSQDRLTLFGLSRKGLEFSERDCLIMTLLRPHLIGALRNVTELGRITLERDLLQKGAEAERQGAVLIQSDGMILCISPFAKEMLERYFNAAIMEGDTLPGRLLQWFKTEANPPSAKGGKLKRVEREPLTIEKDGGRLKIKLLNDFTTGDYILVMAEKDDSLILQNLQGYGLSSRETEVLKWLSQGKSNLVIAIILGMSKRTVDKHLEHIFEKLGVETRAAAAAVMNQ